MPLSPGNHTDHADAVLPLDRRLKGSGSPRCFWVHTISPESSPPKTEATDGRPLPFPLAFSKPVVQRST